MKAKQTLKAIIEYLAGNDFYYCNQYEELFQANECYCADDIYQEAIDNIYTSVKGVLSGYYICVNDLTEEAQEAIRIEAFEEAEKYHIRFYNMKQQEAIEAINNNKELKQLLFERFSNSAHK